MCNIWCVCFCDIYIYICVTYGVFVSVIYIYIYICVTYGVFVSVIYIYIYM